MQIEETEGLSDFLCSASKLQTWDPTLGGLAPKTKNLPQKYSLS